MASSETSPTVSAFFYGTLVGIHHNHSPEYKYEERALTPQMAPEVFFTVCYRNNKPSPDIVHQYTFHPAVLPGYTRHRVRYADYPGIVADEAEGALVRGVLATGLTEDNLRQLDYFEGSGYERRTVKVTLDGKDGDNKTVEALIYVFKNRDGLEPREWDFEEFRREKMHRWAKADYAFEDCDPDDPATVAK